MGRRILWLIEYGAIRGALLALRVMPIKWAYALARLLGFLAWKIDRRHREVAEQNICQVFGLDREDPEVDRLAKTSFCQFTYMAVEIAKFDSLFSPRSKHKVTLEIEGEDAIQKAAADGGGIVFVGGHNGSWEIMGPVMGRIGLPIHVVARPLDNPYFDRWSKKHRERHGVKIVEKSGALSSLVRVLRGGGHVGFFIDQHAGRHGIWVDYLGKKASTMPSPASLARRFSRPLVAGFTFRTKDPRTFRVEFEVVGWPDPTLGKNDDIQRMTEAFNRVIGKRAYDVPDQYLWLHRRWRDVPQTRDRRGDQSLPSSSDDAGNNSVDPLPSLEISNGENSDSRSSC